MRILGGVLIGLMAAIAIIVGVELLNGWMFPLAPANLNDAASVDAMIAAMPVAAKLVVITGWALGALVGAALAVTITRLAWAGWIPAGGVLLGGLLNAMTLAHPWWMDVAALVAPLAGGAAGIALARRRANAA